MTVETLKSLIEHEFDRVSTISEFKQEVFRLLDLFEYEHVAPSYIPNYYLSYEESDEVPYSSICGCNPKNGGSGVCGCTLGNTMVKNPKKYGCGFWIKNLKNTEI